MMDTTAVRRAASIVLLVGLLPLVGAGRARAGNNDDVAAGTDAALTGGAVVANVHTGAAMWFNPAGIAHLENRSLGLTGAMYSVRVLNAPGALTLETGEQSEGRHVASTVIPRALTFIAAPWEDVRVGFGLFNSQVDETYLQDTVASEGAGPSSEWYSTTSSRLSVYHISFSAGWRASESLRIGGALDLVIASRQETRSVSGSYDLGAGGADERISTGAVSASGMQLKAGVQWDAHENITLGLSIASPSYMVYRFEDSTSSSLTSPPTGPPSFEGAQTDELTGTWAGIEPGNLRAGAAFLFDGGWIETDLVYYFPLSSPEFGVDLDGIVNLKVGGMFKMTPKLTLGLGFFSDRSQNALPASFGDSRIDFYGLNVGVDFANRAAAPGPDEEGFYIAFAVALRYAHGSGELAGLMIPATFQPGGPTTNIVDLTVDEVGVNLAVKFNF